jgi:hypothetical protein
VEYQEKLLAKEGMASVATVLMSVDERVVANMLMRG